MTLRDATEYQFTTPGWRVLVRGAAGAAGVDQAANDYAATIESFLGATDMRIQPRFETKTGAEAAVVRAKLPAPPESQAGDATVRTVFLQFKASPLAELTLLAGTDDPAAEAEFVRLYQTARPAPGSDPVREVARALSAGPTGREGHPAGPIVLQLTPTYRATGAFLLASVDGTERYQLEALPAAAPVELPSSILAAGVGATLDETGRTIRYETGVRPRRFVRGPGSPPLTVGAREFESLPPAPAADAVVLDGAVGGTPIRLRVAAMPPGIEARDRAENLLRALQPPP